RSTKTLGTGTFSLGLFTNHAVNTLPYFDDPDFGKSNDKSKSYNDGITGMNLNLGYGITPNWDLGINIPGVVYQDVKSQEYHGQFKKKGITDIQVSTKLNLWNNEKTGLAIILSADLNQVKNNPFTGKGSKPFINAEMAMDTKISNFMLAGNLGYRFRSQGDPVSTDDGETPVNPIKSQIIGSTALQYSIPDSKTDLVMEIYGSQPQKGISEISPRSATVLEGIGGIKYHFDNNLIGHLGAGTELVHSVNSPDFRAYAGIYWLGNGKKKESPKESAELPPPIPPKPDKTIVINDVLFAFDSAKISHEAAQKNLKHLGEVLKNNKLERLIVEGHACVIGTPKYNLELSRHRAEAIKNWLVKEFSIPPSKITAVGYGDTRPVAPNKTVEGRRLNRRTEFKIYYDKSQEIVQANKK
ncbi:MAG: OmpA family protein, partial [Oligoflexales bacterium]|nr:OmpA family protein [Oligoflexales bacterium]